MRVEGRRILLGLVTFTLVMFVGAWPCDGTRIGFSRVMSALANGVFEHVALDAGLEIELVPVAASAVRGDDQNVEEDTRVIIRRPDGTAIGQLGLSLRRDAYLPLLIFSAALLAAPLARRAKLVGLVAGVPFVLFVAVASVWILATFLSSQQKGTGLVAWQTDVVTFLFERWLTPPGNRVIAPLLLAAAWSVGSPRRPTTNSINADAAAREPRG